MIARLHGDYHVRARWRWFHSERALQEEANDDRALLGGVVHIP